MRKGLVFLMCLGSLVSGLTQAQVLNTADQPQVMGAEGSNSPTLQLPSNPPSGSSAEMGNSQGGSTIQGIESPAVIKLNPQTPVLVPNKTQGPQAVSKSIKKDAIKLNAKRLEVEPGLKAGVPKVGAKNLNSIRSPGSLLGNGLGKSSGFPGSPGMPNTFGRPGTKTPGSTAGRSSLPGLTGMPTLPGGSKVPSATPGLPGLGKTKTTKSSGNQLPGLPGAGKSKGFSGSNGGGSSIPKSALPDPSNPFGSRARGVAGAPDGGSGGQGGIPSELVTDSMIMQGKLPPLPLKSLPPLSPLKGSGGNRTGKTKGKWYVFSSKRPPSGQGYRVQAAHKDCPEESTTCNITVRYSNGKKVWWRQYKLKKKEEKKAKKKKPKKPKYACNPQDPACDTRSEKEKMAEVKKKLGGKGAPGQGDDMKPVRDDGSNDGTGGTVRDDSGLISRPSKDSQTQKFGGGRIVTDLEKTGNPGVNTD